MRIRHGTISLFVGLLAFCQTALGEGSAAGDRWLEWNVPQECPPHEYIEGQLQRWLGSNYDPTRGEVRATASVSWLEGQWTVTARFKRGDDESERSLAVGSCTEAADFVALSIALLVNPDLAPGEEGPIVEEAASRPDDSDALEKPRPASVSRNADLDLRSEEGTNEFEAIPTARARHFIPLFLGAGAGLRTGVFPKAAPLAFVTLGLKPKAWRFQISGAAVPHLQHTAETARSPAVYRLFVGQAEGCRIFAAGSFALGPCAGLEAGSLVARKKGGDATGLFWSAVQLLGRAEAEWKWGGTFLHLGAQMPLTPAEFRLEGGTLVHRSTLGFDGKMAFFVHL